MFACAALLVLGPLIYPIFSSGIDGLLDPALISEGLTLGTCFCCLIIPSFSLDLEVADE